MKSAAEPLDVIILPYKDCPCGQHPNAYVDMLIYRSVPYGIFRKIEIICDITDTTYEMLPAFIEKE
tara:strand:- start:193 stop:390 length:198 start_codon:yes stop_codon:yes gene_type:complete